MENQTVVTEFILLGFSDLSVSLQILLFCLFLVIYLFTLMGNLIIIAMVTLDPVLHTPMYFFLKNVSIIETFVTTVTVPKMLANLLAEEKGISFLGCATQLFFFLFLGITECFLLAVMSYDRYVAICDPLHYSAIMYKEKCAWLAAISWTGSMLLALRQTSLMFTLPYCGPNQINHFFCDIPPLLKLACTDTSMRELEISIYGLCELMTPCILILISYTRILSTILRIASAKGRQKAFSTCASHLISVTLLYGSATVAYLIPRSWHSQALHSDKVVALFYAVMIPLLNPIVYSLRNKELKEALSKWSGTGKLFPQIF
ncbi:olfactory receptor 10A7-like [Rhinatrema bivittatum]|uniref:olfactory receptor 10A7-like n=1 Tax=Rhinatrema bivittatum TaxID=194408 RepID=UPI001129802F|nr:olfactory receptor 10A7-like [Rhinatrema bivittatum]